MYYSSWVTVHISIGRMVYLYACRRLDEFGPRTTMTGSCCGINQLIEV